jgi:AcrR family transcriptional regulator
VAVVNPDHQYRPRQARREATTLTIMDAVETLLAERPYAELRVEDVMAASGMTRTAFYRYFPDLESVLLALLARVGVEIAEAANKWLLLEADPDAGILEAATGLAEVWSRHWALLLAFSDAATSGSRVQVAWHELIESFLEPVERRFDDLARRGRTALAHPAETARALVWMNERYLFETFARNRSVTVEEAAATLGDIWRSVLFATPS